MVTAPFTISEAAAKRIQALQAKDPSKKFFRIAIDGGGCNGFQYQFSFESAKGADDIVIDDRGVQVLIDPTSLELINQAEIDFVEDMIGNHFQVNNPNAATACGCGNSFSI